MSKFKPGDLVSWWEIEEPIYAGTHWNKEVVYFKTKREAKKYMNGMKRNFYLSCDGKKIITPPRDACEQHFGFVQSITAYHSSTRDEYYGPRPLYQSTFKTERIAAEIGNKLATILCFTKREEVYVNMRYLKVESHAV